jgi:hypothetical protein
MKVTADLMRWQYQGYPLNHKDPVNLIIHIITAPLFVAAGVGVLVMLVQARWWLAAACVGAMGLVVVLQGIGHAREQIKPEPFLSPVDFYARIMTENFLTFWRFVFSGRWYNQLKLGFSKKEYR